MVNTGFTKQAEKGGGGREGKEERKEPGGKGGAEIKESQDMAESVINC